jgi:hypothetical protein
MGKMPPPHGLGVHHTVYLANYLLIHQKFSQLEIVRAVSQDMADGKDLGASQGLDSLVHGKAVVHVGSQGLLAHDVQIQRSEGDNDFSMHIIEDTDKGTVDTLGDLSACSSALPTGLFIVDKLGPACEGLSLAGTAMAPNVLATQRLSLELERLTNRSHDSIADLFDGAGVSVAS